MNLSSNHSSLFEGLPFNLIPEYDFTGVSLGPARAYPKPWSIAEPVFGRIDFDLSDPAGKLVHDLIDLPAFQRLRRVSQLANAEVVYPSATHARFVHCIGAAFLALRAMDKIAQEQPEARDTIAVNRTAVAAAAALHDILHLAPGSHLAFKVFFPGARDQHEELGIKLIKTNSEIQSVLAAHGPRFAEKVANILSSSSLVPNWTSQIISGGPWNVDRGNWVYLDGVTTGINVGRYPVDSLIERLRILPSDELAISYKGMAALESFAMARLQLYRDMYQHRAVIAADETQMAMGRRARDLFQSGDVASLQFCDETMQELFSARDVEQVSLETLLNTSDSWWSYHVERWAGSKDSILSDLASRVQNRNIFKAIPLTGVNSRDAIIESAALSRVEELGFDPRYYYSKAMPKNFARGSFDSCMKVISQDGQIQDPREVSDTFRALASASESASPGWVFVPKEAR